MGEAKRRAEREGLISVLVPERGRPIELHRLMESLGRHPDVEIVVQIDDDDVAWKDMLHCLSQPAWPSVRFIVKPRPPSLGEKLNQLAEEAKGGLLWFVANDMIMASPDWPVKFREAAAKLPDGIGVCYPRDMLHPGHTSYWMLTRRMYETVGFFAPPWFPYWFVDTWWDEIGTLIDRKVEIDCDLRSPDGRGDTIGGRPDLAFWSQFFEETRPMRVRDAVMLLGGPVNVRNRPLNAIEQAWLNEYMPRINERMQVCAGRTAHLHTEAFQKRWGTEGSTAPEVKAIAEQLLSDLRAQAPRQTRVALAIPSGRSWEAATACAVASLAAYSTSAGIVISILNMQTSMISQGRNSSVEIALKAGCDYILWIDSDMQFPPNALVRLLGHGKDVVGATYNKRVPPYETLGKLVGPKPDKIEGGLLEALLLPSGLLLVKADVYRKLAYPWYAEGYQWPGEDGLERWWNMMQDYFGAVPPDAVSASVSGTVFETWMRDNFTLSEFGDDPMLLSEDLFFMRKCRRHGITPWCDLDLTYETIHLGVLPVTCVKPDAASLPADVVSAGRPPLGSR